MTEAPKESSPYQTPKLAGEHYELLPMTVGNVSERYIAWLNDPEVNRFLEVRFMESTLESASTYVESFDGSVERYMWGIYTLESALHIGTTTLYDIERNHGSAVVGLLVGDRGYWGKGVSEEALSLVVEFAFHDLGLRRLAGASYAANWGMNFTFKKLGFSREGRMRKAFAVGPGEYGDGYRWGLLEDEWA